DRNANIRAEGGGFSRSMDIDINSDFARVEKFFPPTRQLAAHIGDSIVNDRRRVVPSGLVHTIHLGTDLPSTTNCKAWRYNIARNRSSFPNAPYFKLIMEPARNLSIRADCNGGLRPRCQRARPRC